MKITILIPILNEEAQLRKREKALHQLRAHPSVHQLLFSDSGSTDFSLDFLKSAGFDYQERIFQGTTSIGQAIGQCLERIQTEKIMILPVDVQIEVLHLDHVLDALMVDSNRVYVFQKEYDVQSFALKLGQWLLKFAREGLLRNFVWTNVFCISKDDLRLIPKIGFLEDVLFNDHLKKIKKISRLESTVVVSARKYVKDGPWFRLFVNLIILGLFRTGLFQPITLRKLYQFSKQQTDKGEFHENDSVQRASDSTFNEPASCRIG